MKVSTYISEKLKVVSFIGVIFVVFIHSTLLNISEFVFFDNAQMFLRGIWNSFYPLFFSISGYLFFVGIKGEKQEFFYKYKSRFRSLLIPFIIWNVLFLSIMLLLKYNPLTGGMINSDFSMLFELNVFGWFYELFIEPIGFHLWFIRDLIAMVFFAPVIWFLIHKVKLFFIGLLIFFNIYFNDLPLLGSFVPFSIGAFIAINNFKLNLKPKIMVLLFSVLSIVFGWLRVKGLNLHALEFYYAWAPFLMIWFGYDVLVKKGVRFNLIHKFTSYSFFIYVFHEPYLNIFKKMILKISAGQEWGVWCSYLISPIVTVFIAILIAMFLEKYVSTIYKYCNGGR
jgi:hypothetical protein